MPRRSPPPRFPFQSYQHLLRVLTDGGMTMVQCLPDDMGRDGSDALPPLDFSTGARHFAVISGLVCRSIVVSRYISTLSVPTEEREHRLGPALERVFRQFAARKITIEDYNRAVDAEIGGELDEEFGDGLAGDGEAREYDLEAGVRGRPPRRWWPSYAAISA